MNLGLRGPPRTVNARHLLAINIQPSPVIVASSSLPFRLCMDTLTLPCKDLRAIRSSISAFSDRTHHVPALVPVICVSVPGVADRAPSASVATGTRVRIMGCQCVQHHAANCFCVCGRRRECSPAWRRGCHASKITGSSDLDYIYVVVAAARQYDRTPTRVCIGWRIAALPTPLPQAYSSSFSLLSTSPSGLPLPDFYASHVPILLHNFMHTSNHPCYCYCVGGAGSMAVRSVPCCGRARRSPLMYDAPRTAAKRVVTPYPPTWPQCRSRAAHRTQAGWAALRPQPRACRRAVTYR
jgi:hypothetical protein